MPDAVAAISVFVTWLGGTSFWAGVVKSVIAVGLSVLAQTLQKKPKRGGARDSGQNLMVRQPNYPRRLIYGKARVGGIWFFVETTGATNRYLHLVLGICDGPIEAIDEIYFGDKLITLDSDGFAEGDFAGDMRIKLYLGDQTEADPDLVAESSNWTTNHKLLGIAYAYVRLTHNDRVFANGLEDFSFVVRGRNDIYDSRSNTTGYSNNNALCWRHYMQLPAPIGPGAADAEIDIDYLEEAADVCDEAVDLLAGGTEARYACDVVISLDEDPEEITSTIVAAMAGSQLYTNGKFRVLAGAYRTPTFTITEGMIVGPVTLRNRAPKDQRVNLVKATYRDPTNKYQPFDAPRVENSTYQTADGEVLARDLNLDATLSGARAQRIMKIEMERSRQEVALNLICNFAAWPVQAGENVMVTLPRYGFESKVFAVNSITLATQDDAPVLQIGLSAESEDVYAWDETTEEKAVNVPNSLSADGPSIDLTATPEPPGPERKVLSLHAETEWLAVADSSSFDFMTGDMTMSAWVKFRDTAGQNASAVLIGQLKAGDGVDTGIGIRATDSFGVRTLRVAGRDASGTFSAEVGTVPPAGQWIFVMVRVSGTNVEIYAKSEDGLYDETASTSIATAVADGTVDFTIGAESGGAGGQLSADVGPCGLWSNNLDNAERDSLYNGGVIKYRADLVAAEETDLVEWWDLEEQYGDRLGSEGLIDLAEGSATCVAARGQDPDYPINVELEAGDLNAVILYSFTENSLSKNDLGSGSNQLATNPGTISVSSGTPITAQAYVEEAGFPAVVSNIVRGVYNYVPGDLSAATLEWHLDACRGTRLVPGLPGSVGAVEKWYDQSGKGNHAEQPGATSLMPALIASAVDGLPAVQFDGVDDFLEIPQAFSGGTWRTLFVVLRSSQTGTAEEHENVFFDLQDGATPSAGAAWAISWRRKLAVLAADPITGGHFVFNSVILSGRWYVAQIQWYGTHVQLTTDLLLNFAVQPAHSFESVAINTATTTKSLIGKTNMFSGSHFAGEIAEMLLYNGVMSAGERRFLHYHLRGKYGLL